MIIYQELYLIAWIFFYLTLMLSRRRTSSNTVFQNIQVIKTLSQSKEKSKIAAKYDFNNFRRYSYASFCYN